MTRACWLRSDNQQKLEDFIRFKFSNIVYDKDGHLVYLAPSDWFLKMERENNPEIEFHFNSEFKTEVLAV
jgi:peptide chain release factor 3